MERHQFAAVEGYVEEELESDDGCIQRRRRNTGVNEVQLIVAQIIDGCRVGRTSKVLREVANRADVSALRLGAELRIRRSSSMRCRSGLMPVWAVSMVLLPSKKRRIACSSTSAKQRPLPTKTVFRP